MQGKQHAGHALETVTRNDTHAYMSLLRMRTRVLCMHSMIFALGSGITISKLFANMKGFPDATMLSRMYGYNNVRFCPASCLAWFDVSFSVPNRANLHNLLAGVSLRRFRPHQPRFANPLSTCLWGDSGACGGGRNRTTVCVCVHSLVTSLYQLVSKMHAF